jgi:hypothetical protein
MGRCAYRVSVEKPVGRPIYRCEDIIKMDLEINGMGCSGLDSSGSGQGHVAGSCEHGHEPSGSIQCEEFIDWLRSYSLHKRVTPWKTNTPKEQSGT